MKLIPLNQTLSISPDAREVLIRTLQPHLGEVMVYCYLDDSDAEAPPSLYVGNGDDQQFEIKDTTILVFGGNVNLDYLGLAGRQKPEVDSYVIATIVEAKAEGWYVGDDE